MSGTVRQPRTRVTLNGSPVGGLLSVDIDCNNNFSADTFSAEFSANATNGEGLYYWGSDSNDTVLVNVEMTPDLQSADFTNVFSGQIDDIEASPVSGIVKVRGRDLSRRLRDAKTEETFLNQTSSEVATLLATRHMLKPVVTATQTRVNRFYSADHDQIKLGNFTRTTTEWDLLVYLARHEGYDMFVTGQELHFQPITDLSANPFHVAFSNAGAGVVCNVIEPMFSRYLTLSKDLRVTVRSWNASKKTGFDVVAGGKGSPSKSGQTQNVVVVRPNLTYDAANNLAISIRRDLTLKERLFQFRMPGDVLFTPRTPVLVTGTGSSWDGPYFTASVTRRMATSGGFAMSIKCKNHSPANESIPT